MANDTTGAALELRTWAARNRHDLAGTIRGSERQRPRRRPRLRSGPAVLIPRSRRSSRIVDLAAADGVLAEAATVDHANDLGCRRGSVLRVHQGRPAIRRRSSNRCWVRCTVGSSGVLGRAFTAMTAHAYGLVGRPLDALRLLDRLAIELDRRGTVARYRRSDPDLPELVLRNQVPPRRLPSWPPPVSRSGQMEIRGQCTSNISDCLLRAGQLSNAESHLDLAQREAQQHWFHNRWRFSSSDRAPCRPGASRSAAVTPRPPRTTPPSSRRATRRGDRRYQVVGRLLSAAAEARLRPGTVARAADRARPSALLGEVAALEGCVAGRRRR